MITWRELLKILQFLERCDSDKLDTAACIETGGYQWNIIPKDMSFPGAIEDRFSPIQLRLLTREIVQRVNELKTKSGKTNQTKQEDQRG